MTSTPNPNYNRFHEYVDMYVYWYMDMPAVYHHI